MLANWDKNALKEIEQSAYFKWIDAGRPCGAAQKWWDLAEQETFERTKLEEVVEITYKKPYRWFSGGGSGGVASSRGINMTTASGHTIEMVIDLSQVPNRGNSRYKDVRQTLSDEAIKDLIKEFDRGLIQYDYWGE